MRATISQNSVEAALDSVRQLANRPVALVDPYALVAALGQLADLARETDSAEKKEVPGDIQAMPPPCKGTKVGGNRHPVAW